MTGKLTGVGVGPGDPDLMTVRGARALAGARVVYAPRSPASGESLALAIARPHLNRDAEIVVLEYELTADRARRDAYWREAAARAVDRLSRGEDAVFLTIGDPLLYSTWIYFMRAAAAIAPGARISTVPGVDAVSAAAALSGTPLGEGRKPFVVIPGGGDLESLGRALGMGGTVAVMKLGRHLPAVAALLADRGLLERAALVARVGLDGERVVRGLSGADVAEPGIGDMAVLLIDAENP